MINDFLDDALSTERITGGGRLCMLGILLLLIMSLASRNKQLAARLKTTCYLLIMLLLYHVSTSTLVERLKTTSLLYISINNATLIARIYLYPLRD